MIDLNNPISRVTYGGVEIPILKGSGGLEFIGSAKTTESVSVMSIPITQWDMNTLYYFEIIGGLNDANLSLSTVTTYFKVRVNTDTMKQITTQEGTGNYTSKSRLNFINGVLFSFFANPNGSTLNTDITLKKITVTPTGTIVANQASSETGLGTPNAISFESQSDTLFWVPETEIRVYKIPKGGADE